MTELRINDAEDSDVSFLAEEADKLDLEMGAPHSPLLKKDFQLACDDSGTIVAEAVITARYGIAQIEKLHVEKNHRLRGYGREILGRIEEFARASGIRSIKTSTYSWGQPTLYDHCGYKEVARLPLAATINGAPQYDITFSKVLN